LNTNIYFIERIDILLSIQFTLSASCELINARGLVRPLADARNYYSYLCKSHSKGIAGYPFKTESSFFSSSSKGQMIENLILIAANYLSKSFNHN